MLYEIDNPQTYILPDVVVDFTQVQVCSISCFNFTVLVPTSSRTKNFTGTVGFKNLFFKIKICALECLIFYFNSI